MQNREECALPKMIFIFFITFVSHQHSFSPCSKLRLRYIALACTTFHLHITW